ncbi:hypothetical protein [Nocardioides sp. GY 10127]|uniref:hypothetical protein n=1 Tax=Nocardioides sp. GY 10127 TaxID=2569762 RepID=UPI0019801B46|nr:hypothetical protein [Nocardioides sp. GY 10127]
MSQTEASPVEPPADAAGTVTPEQAGSVGPDTADTAATADDTDAGAPETSQQPAVDESSEVLTPSDDRTPDDTGGAEEDPHVGWWRRGHPTFAALVGFYTGLVFVLVVPGAYAGVLSLVTDRSTAASAFPFVLLAFVVPIGLLVPRLTRRFARYMLLGIFSTALVVAIAGGVTLYVLYERGL